MRRRKAFDALADRLAAVMRSRHTDLLTLSLQAGLEPEVDFQMADLRDLDLSGEDLSRFSFQGADLRGAKLDRARISRASIEGAWLDGASLSDVAWIPDNDIFARGLLAGWRPRSDVAALRHLLAGVSPFDAEGRYALTDLTEIRDLQVPWSARASLVALRDPTWRRERLVVCFLRVDDQLHRLDGQSAAIHAANDELGLALSAAHVRDYLRFFCLFVHGDDGPFLVLERVDDPLLAQDMDEKTRATLAGLARTVELVDEPAGGPYGCNAIILYGAAVFAARMSVAASGTVEMLDDDPLAGPLPVRLSIEIA